jgi:hypothetical protein
MEVQSRAPQGHPDKTTFDIVVNGEAKTWDHKKINYEQIVKLAFPNGPTGGDIRYSVTWTKPDGTEGSLRPGQPPVDVVDEMIFDVRNTDKS